MARNKNRYLPKKIIEKINEVFSKKTQRDKAIRIVLQIIDKSFEEHDAMDGWVEIPSQTWQTWIGEHYERYLHPLIEAGIVISPHAYSTEDHTCKSYRIASGMLNDQFIKVTFEAPASRKQNDCFVCRKTKQILRKLKLNLRGAKKATSRRINNQEFMEDILVDDAITDGDSVRVKEYYLDGNSKEYFNTLQEIKSEAKKSGKSLFKVKNAYILDYPKQFILRKKEEIRFNYINALERFSDREFYARRNYTNHRLDTNITNMQSVLLGYFTYNNEKLLSIDLSNSQFTFLASLIQSGVFNEFLDNKVIAEYDLNEISTVAKVIRMPQRYQSLARAGNGEIMNAHYFSKIQTYISNFYTANVAKPNNNQSTNHILNNKTISINQSVGQLYNTLPSSTYIYSVSGTDVVTFMSAILDKKKGVVRMLKPVIPRDLTLFIKLAKSGQFYEYIVEKLNLKGGRAEAKQMMFGIFFSKRRHNPAQKVQLKSLFPTLIYIIDSYKKKYGDNQVAILLQKKESQVFIDQILTRLLEEGYTVLSKHDSILCLPSERAAVEQIIREILDEELGRYQLKITWADGAEYDG